MRYQIWDKKSDIYTPGVDQNGKGSWTAEEYIATRAPWAAHPAAKCIITTGLINGGVFMEFGATIEAYRRMGVVFTDDMTDDECLRAIEAFEDKVPETPVDANERIAAALEFQNILSMEGS